MSDVLTLWKQGLDTLEIARRLHTQEHAVYNALAKIKGQRVYVPDGFANKRRKYADKLRSAGIRGDDYRKAITAFTSEHVHR